MCSVFSSFRMLFQICYQGEVAFSCHKNFFSLFATCKLGRDLYSGSTYIPVYTVLYMPLLVTWTAHPNCCHMPSELVHHVNHVLSCIQFSCQYVKSLVVTPKNVCTKE
ncbi:unnamed protein product [Ixodes pacificus]